MGWALGGRTPQCGVVDFHNSRFEGGGMRFLKFERWLTNTTDNYGVTEIYFEEVRAHKGVDAAHIYGGFLSVLTKFCEDHEIPYAGVPVGTIKKFATGKGNASKQEVMDAAREMGYQHRGDDNAADAAMILEWARTGG